MAGVLEAGHHPAAALDPVTPGTVVSFRVSTPDGDSRIVNVRVPPN